MPLGKSSQESRACCGVADVFPRRRGLGLLICFVGSCSFNESETVVFESPGESFPTPAGVLAKDVLDNWFQNGLGGEVSNGSNP